MKGSLRGELANMYEIRLISQKQEYYRSFVRLVSQSLLSISLVMHCIGSDRTWILGKPFYPDKVAAEYVSSYILAILAT